MKEKEGLIKIITKYIEAEERWRNVLGTPYYKGKSDGAIEAYKEILELIKKLEGEEHAQTNQSS